MSCNDEIRMHASEGRDGSTSGDRIDALVGQAMLSQAAALARRGEYAAAANLLNQLVGQHNEGAAALDLLARIHAQQGRLSEAETFWRRALEIEPNNQSYLAGLNRIARIRSRPTWANAVSPIVSIFTVAIMLVLVGWFLINYWRGSPLDNVAQAGSAASHNSATSPAVPPARKITLQLRGQTVRMEDDRIVIVPDPDGDRPLPLTIKILDEELILQANEGTRSSPNQ
jgi:tetratricopeptide (TPR) repeat protein